MQLCGATDQVKFYQDPHMMDLMNMNMKLADVEVLDLGVSLTINNVERKFLKLIHHNFGAEVRNVMIVGIQIDQVSRWSAGFQKQILSSNEVLDRSLMKIKENICYEKDLDQYFDNTSLNTQNDSITLGIQGQIDNILSNNIKPKMSVK
jgi:hypothetical protein